MEKTVNYVLRTLYTALCSLSRFLQTNTDSMRDMCARTRVYLRTSIVGHIRPPRGVLRYTRHSTPAVSAFEV